MRCHRRASRSPPPAPKKTWFIPGVSPIRVCQVHRRVPIDTATGKRACQMVPGKTRMETFAFWPSDLLTIFRAAGMMFNEPPPWSGGCGLDRRAADGQAPEITSPQPGQIYAKRSRPRPDDRIPFSAVGDGDARRFYWFVDNHFVGVANAGQPLMWTPRSGVFQVQVVDDHSRAAMTALTVEIVR